VDLAQAQGRTRRPWRRGGLTVADPLPLNASHRMDASNRLDGYDGWSAAEIAADEALADSIHALSQADGLLNPALDPIFARRPSRPRQALRAALSGPHAVQPQEDRAMGRDVAGDAVPRWA
jgi:hypothetical protein